MPLQVLLILAYLRLMERPHGVQVRDSVGVFYYYYCHYLNNGFVTVAHKFIWSKGPFPL